MILLPEEGAHAGGLLDLEGDPGVARARHEISDPALSQVLIGGQDMVARQPTVRTEDDIGTRWEQMDLVVTHPATASQDVIEGHLTWDTIGVEELVGGRVRIDNGMGVRHWNHVQVVPVDRALRPTDDHELAIGSRHAPEAPLVAVGEIAFGQLGDTELFERPGVTTPEAAHDLHGLIL